MSRNADVVIIGGGIIGTSLSYYLSKTGAKVVLIEAGDIANGTSSKCDGNVLISDKMPGYDSKLAKLSQDKFPQLQRELDYNFEWTRRGSLNLMENEIEMIKAEEYCEGLAASGIPVRMLDEKEVHEDEPLLSPCVIGGLEVSCDGSVYPMGLCYGLILGAKKLGAEFMLNTSVIAIEKDENKKISKVITDRGEILTDKVVCAAGVWSKEIGNMVGLDIPIEARQGQILVAEQTYKVARRKVVEFGYLMAKFQGSDYKRDVTPDIEEYGVAFVFEPTAANNFLIGSSRRFVGRDITTHMGVMRALAKRAIHFFPCLKDINVIRAYAGLRPYAKDHFPIVSDTDIPGFYISCGHEGDGIGLSLISAEIMTNIITKQDQRIDVLPLSFNRFKEGNTIHQ